MTRETNPTHNERLMVAVRIKPTDHITNVNRIVNAITSTTLLFTDGSGGEKAAVADHDNFNYFNNAKSSGSSTNNGYNSYGPQPPGSSSLPNSRGKSQGQNLSTNTPNNGNMYRASSNPHLAEGGKVYEFDYVFDEQSSQEEVYRATAAPLVRSVFEGFCATVFAYGATSSGKTYTMVGTPTHPGIMKRAIDDIFELSTDPRREGKTEVYLSYLEIYNEKIRDLLRPVPGVHLELREDMEQVHVSGLSEVQATSTNEVLNLLQKGNRARTMEPTAANMTSSRSHAVLLVTVRQFSDDEREVTDGKLYLIDLAGSERASHTKNSGLRLREGGHINRSLLALGNCITALAAGDDKYINYRDSKLTRLLKVALGGTSKTVMIAHVSPFVLHREETRNTLLYGQRARSISNRVKKFIYPGQSSETGYIIDELRNEVRRLQKKLEEREDTPPDVRRNAYSSSVPSPPVPLTLSQSSMSGPLYHEGYIDKHERHELIAVKQQLSSLFDEEFRLRNDLLKLDGAMLQSALDCEILRLMVLDWENLKSSKDFDKDGGDSMGELEQDNSEISTVMHELKQVRLEQDKLLRLRSEVEQDLQKVRSRISLFEEEATQYLPEIQREILTLLCKLQQDQLNKMSVEIESELKRRGSLLLRCLRQKALGEAIIHRQRHFISGNSIALSPISGSIPRSSEGLGERRFLPPLLPLSSNKPNSGERAVSMSNNAPRNLPPLGSAVPTTTKYSDFRKNRELVQRQLVSSSDDDFDEKRERERLRGGGGSPRKQKSNKVASALYSAY